MTELQHWEKSLSKALAYKTDVKDFIRSITSKSKNTPLYILNT